MATQLAPPSLVMVRANAPSATCHNFIVGSLMPPLEAKILPSGEKAKQVTSLLCAIKVRTRTPSEARQKLIAPSLLAEASVASGLSAASATAGPSKLKSANWRPQKARIAMARFTTVEFNLLAVANELVTHSSDDGFFMVIHYYATVLNSVKRTAREPARRPAPLTRRKISARSSSCAHS
jgi:hypothetical protein